MTAVQIAVLQFVKLCCVTLTKSHLWSSVYLLKLFSRFNTWNTLSLLVTSVSLTTAFVPDNPKPVETENIQQTSERCPELKGELKSKGQLHNWGL